jgi:hypothetical protein
MTHFNYMIFCYFFPIDKKQANCFKPFFVEIVPRFFAGLIFLS